MADAAKKPKREKRAAIKEAPASDKLKSRKRPMKGHGRLYVKAIFTGCKRVLRNQHENTVFLMIDLKIEGTNSKDSSWFYVDKKCVYVFKAKNKTCVPGKPKSKVPAIWGKVTRPHGTSRVISAKFKRNLPPKAMGHHIHIMMYPSRI